MKVEKFKVLLYLKKSGTDKSGKASIMGRITVNRTMAQFGCKLSCRPDLWNARESRLDGKSREAVETNAKLDKLLLAVNAAFDTLVERERDFDATEVKDLFQGSIETQMTLLRMTDRICEDVKARIGIDRAKGTYPGYYYMRKTLGEFIPWQFKTKNIAFGQLTEQFIHDYQNYVMDVKGLAVDTVRHYLAILKKVCRIAYKEGYAERCHFANFTLPQKTERTPRALSREDFEKIRDVEIPAWRTTHILVRDLFLFACYTGTAYADVVSVTRENLYTDDNGTEDFGNSYKAFLKRYKNFSPSQTNKCLCWLSKLVYLAVDYEILRANPLEDMEYEKKPAPKHRHISRAELKNILETPMLDPMQELGRRAFLFSTFTGLAYVDIMLLHPHHIGRTADGRRYIRINRKKTNVEAFIPLHPIAEQILDLYNTTDDTKPVFPLPSRDEMWFEIHELGVAIGREENLSYHQARHSFGTFLISEGIPIESIAKMMGHSGIRTTQRYAEVTDKKISKDMDNLMAVRMMYGTGKWYKRQELPKETDFDNGQIG